jgi:GTPase SAR1 family protein
MLNSSPTVHSTLKIMMLGDLGTGKTSLIRRIVSMQTPQKEPEPEAEPKAELVSTFTIDFTASPLDFEGGQLVLRLYDTPGLDSLRQCAVIHHPCPAMYG